ncbi:uncharacterized protein PV07_10068 [Cladophialophora immunda]|uniref:Uncharacterized protein n=1 Tax=Cladophialophora immunda TaxID=569365 RepID=A0A0D2CL94_9EURO|nr:uncharacterized protein PV07_10068 [Cladophialophora immunda]KIW24349.1 hypothetical protein PV07_10068 [Cladophialophora immunda]
MSLAGPERLCALKKHLCFHLLRGSYWFEPKNTPEGCIARIPHIPCFRQPSNNRPVACAFLMPLLILDPYITLKSAYEPGFLLFWAPSRIAADSHVDCSQHWPTAEQVSFRAHLFQSTSWLDGPR